MLPLHQNQGEYTMAINWNYVDEILEPINFLSRFL